MFTYFEYKNWIEKILNNLERFDLTKNIRDTTLQNQMIGGEKNITIKLLNKRE